MRFILMACGTLLFSAFVILAGSGLLFGVIPLHARAIGFSDTSIGVLGSFYFAGMLLGCVIAPTLLRAVGHVRVFAAAAAIATAMPLGHALFSEPLAWGFMRLVTGCCFAVIYAIIESWLNERATNEIRGMVLAVYNIINYAAIASGQQMLRLYDIGGFELFSLTAILISIAAVPVVLTPTTAPTPPDSPKLRPIWLYHISPVAFAGAIAVGLVNGAFWSLAPVYATSLGLSASGSADFITASIIGTVVTLFPIGRASDRMDRRTIMAVVTGLSVISALGLALFAILGLSSYWVLMGLSMIFGAAAMPIYALAGAHGNDHAKPEELVQVSTGLLLLYTIGAIIGPIITSLLMSGFGAGFLFLWVAVIHTLLLGYTIWRMTQRAPVKEKYREPFVPMPRTSPMAVELSPLVQDELSSVQ